MREPIVKRAIVMVLFGMASFFLIAALITLMLWTTMGDSRQFLREIAFVSVFVAIPVANYLATRALADHR